MTAHLRGVGCLDPVLIYHPVHPDVLLSSFALGLVPRPHANWESDGMESGNKILKTRLGLVAKTVIVTGRPSRLERRTWRMAGRGTWT